MEHHLTLDKLIDYCVDGHPPEQILAEHNTTLEDLKLLEQELKVIDEQFTVAEYTIIEGQPDGNVYAERAWREAVRTVQHREYDQAHGDSVETVALFNLNRIKEGVRQAAIEEHYTEEIPF